MNTNFTFKFKRVLFFIFIFCSFFSIKTFATKNVHPSAISITSPSGSSVSICQNGSVSFTATITTCTGGASGATTQDGITYQWFVISGTGACTGGAGQTASSALTTTTTTNTFAFNSTSITNNTATTGTYQIYCKVTDGTPATNACGGGATSYVTSCYTVIVNALPTPTLSADITTFCSGASSTLTAGGGTSYAWSPITNLTPTTGSIVVATPTVTTVYTVTVTDGNSCTASTSQALTVNQPPTITTQPVDKSFCPGSSTNFSVVASGFAPLSYQWQKAGVNLVDGGSVSGSATSTLTINPAAAGDVGSYDVVVTGGCNPTATSSIVNLTVSAANAGPDQTVAGTTATLAGNSATPGTGAWTRTTGSGTITTSSSPTSGITAMTAAGNTNTFRWTVTNGTCNSNDDVIIKNYCSSGIAVSSFSSYISNVTFNTINNTTGATQTDYSSISTTLIPNNVYTLSVTPAAGTDYLYAYFDWNGDGKFTGTGEAITLSTNTSAGVPITGTITIPCTASAGTVRMRVIIADFSATSCPTSSDTGESEDYTLVISPSTTLTYSSSSTTQNSSPVAKSTTNQQIIGLQILTTGTTCSSSLSATSFTFNTSGTTAAGTDITNAKLWYTTSSATFATTTQVGSTIAAPNGVLTFTGTAALVGGTSYFWLSYDIPAGATTNNVVDATCTSITVGGTAYAPSPSAPSGSRQIVAGTNISTTTTTTCGMLLYDDGGVGGNYTNNKTYTYTIYPGTAGSFVQAVFSSFSTENTYDYLYIYNGNSTSASLIGAYTGTTSPGTITSCATDGSLTFKFTSDASTVSTGFAAGIYCVSNSAVVTWNGSLSTNWAVAGNWDSGTVPQSCNDVVIPSGISNQPVISSSTAAECKSLTINSGATLAVGSTSGSFTVYGNFTNNGTLNSTGSTALINLVGVNNTLGGSGSYGLNSQFEITASANYTMTGNVRAKLFNIDASGTFSLGANTLSVLDINQTGTINLNTGTLEIESLKNVGGAYYLTDATFNENTGTVNYNAGTVWPAGVQVTGTGGSNTSFTFYNLKTYSPSGGSFHFGRNDNLNVICLNNCEITSSGSGYSHLDVNAILTVGGNLLINSGSVLDCSENTTIGPFQPINVAGNWTNNGSFLEYEGTVTLNGTGTQVIAGTTTTDFYNLTLSKASGSVSLGVNTNVGQGNNSGDLNGVLSLGTGVINLNTYKLTIKNNSLSAITRSTGYIVSEDNSTYVTSGITHANNSGVLSMNIDNSIGIHTYPFGTIAGVYIPFLFKLNGGLSGSFGYVDVATYRSGASAGTNYNMPYPPAVLNVGDYTYSGVDNSSNTVHRFWQITKGGSGSSTGGADITFTYDEALEHANNQPGVFTSSTVVSQRWNGSKWSSPASGQTFTHGATTSTVKNPAVQSFSPWTLALGISPLPIELLNFNANFNKENKVEVTWETVTETNNSYFEVERSADGKNYIVIGQEKGAGSSSIKHTYSLIDKSPLNGVNYYRLKQIDFNGNFTYSEVVSLNLENNLLEKLKNVNITPNPLVNITEIKLNSEPDKEVLVQVFDNQTKLVLSKVYTTTAGDNTFSIDMSAFSSGLFMISITQDGHTVNKKVIKQ